MKNDGEQRMSIGVNMDDNVRVICKSCGHEDHPDNMEYARDRFDGTDIWMCPDCDRQ